MGSSFDQATRAKLIALLDGLGSDSPFERARAGADADRLLKQAGLGWDDVIAAASDKLSAAQIFRDLFGDPSARRKAPPRVDDPPPETCRMVAASEWEPVARGIIENWNKNWRNGELPPEGVHLAWDVLRTNAGREISARRMDDLLKARRERRVSPE